MVSSYPWQALSLPPTVKVRLSIFSTLIFFISAIQFSLETSQYLSLIHIWPENIKLTKAEGHLHGAIKSMFYLGDVNDCQIDINGTLLRVIADPHTYDVLRTGEEIGLEITDFLVYEDDGRDDHNQILT